MALPNELEKRQRIKKDLERSINILNEIEMLNSDLDDIANVLQDESIIKSKEFKAMVKAKFDSTLLAKAKDKVAEIESTLAEVDILENVKG